MPPSPLKQVTPHGRIRRASRLPYSRNGCLRCKKKKVKCDEGKPTCGRCAGDGAECPGSDQGTKWSQKHEIFQGGHITDKPAPTLQRLPGRSATDRATSDADRVVLDGTGSHQAADEQNIVNNPIDEAQSDNQASSIVACAGSDVNWAPWTPSLLWGLTDNMFVQHDVTGEMADISVNIDQITPSFDFALEAQESSMTMESEASQVVLERRLDLTSRASFNNVTYPYVPLHQNLADTSSVLVEFYFRDTARIYSMYDGAMNPFRSAVKSLCDSSRLIYCALQSMAAACLVDVYPHLEVVGRDLRKEVINLIHQGKESNEATLLALLMVGGTSSWHDADDLGTVCFNRCRRKLRGLAASGAFKQKNKTLRFFEESLIYWEMLLAFVVDDDKLEQNDSSLYPPHLNPTAFQSAPLPRRDPHPCTGFARNTQELVQAVGRLVRSQRRSAHSKDFNTQAKIESLQRDFQRAYELEESLLSVATPTEADVSSPEDGTTPVSQLLNIAEAYQRVGLLQLWRVFPDVLINRRRALGEHTETFNSLRLETIGLENNISIASIQNSSRDILAQTCDDWLTSFTLQIVDLLRAIPIEFGTRDFQPFLLVACCSELRLPFLQADLLSDQSGAGLTPISLRYIEVSRARSFILSRLNAFMHCLPGKLVSRCIDIIRTTWERGDGQLAQRGHRDYMVYWMDVMMEEGWETIMS